MPKIRYNNMDNVSTDKTLKEFRQWREERRKKRKDYSFTVPSVPPRLSYLKENRLDTTITWIGHATFFIQYEGMNIVTDPVWARRMGFERRLGEPGIPLQDLPPVDLVLVSHSHYDHLHFGSLRKLWRGDTQLIVPAGLKRKMLRKGFHNCVEMQWWETITAGNIQLTFVPTQHWTRRTPFDTNTSHWGGFVLQPATPEAHPGPTEHRGPAAHPGPTAHPGASEHRGPAAYPGPSEHPGPAAHPAPSEQPGLSEQPGPPGQPIPPGESTAHKLPPNLYFAGDSGYFPGFKEIGARFPIHVALMPIGAYEPEWFMTSQHVNPEEALQAFVDVGAETMIPMHYGTFRLADDTAREALDRLEADRERRGIAPERIRVLGLGETLVIHPELRKSGQ